MSFNRHYQIIDTLSQVAIYVFVVFLCSELYGQVPQDDTADITTLSGISDAAKRHVHSSKARTWQHC